MISNRFNQKHSLTYLFIKYICFLFLFCCFSCEDFVDLPLPDSQLNSEEVFQNQQTAESAVLEIYARLRDDAILTGGSSGIGFLMGLYSDELTNYNPNDPNRLQFYQNSVLPDNTYISGWWQKSYNLIYSCNIVLEKLERSDLNKDLTDQLRGETLTLRALINYYLVQIYGDIPFVLSTDYEVNTHLEKTNGKEVLEYLLPDLREAIAILPKDEANGNHTRIKKQAATLLGARIALQLGLWNDAEELTTELLEDPAYLFNVPLNQVFLSSSASVIWRFEPENSGSNSLEGMTYIFLTTPPPNIALSDKLITSFDSSDLRLKEWTQIVEGNNMVSYEPFKYKLNEPTSTSQEYSVVFRLAEAYLIRAEARFFMDDYQGALSDLNMIRRRAGLNDLEIISDASTLAMEWFHEFFTEFGHRFISLKRLNLLNQSLEEYKPGWDVTDKLLPIPDSELIVNPNLGPQNAGY